jgi:hypothetical protein
MIKMKMNFKKLGVVLFLLIAIVGMSSCVYATDHDVFAIAPGYRMQVVIDTYDANSHHIYTSDSGKVALWDIYHWDFDPGVDHITVNAYGFVGWDGHKELVGTAEGLKITHKHKYYSAIGAGHCDYELVLEGTLWNGRSLTVNTAY